MSLSIGIVGLPNVGKSTLFNALTNNNILAANYPFATIEPNTGSVPIPDDRLHKLAEIYQSKKIIPATVTFVDIAGLVAGASKGEGLGNQFLANIRSCNAIAHVVRAFDDSNVTHVDEQSASPERDIDTINTELVLADIETVEKRKPKLEKEVTTNKNLQPFLETITKIHKLLDENTPLHAATDSFNPEEIEWITKELQLITIKPVIYVFNVGEQTLTNRQKMDELQKLVAPSQAIFVCAKLEHELQSLDEADRIELLQSYGVKESGLVQLIHAAYDTLKLQSYLTAGEKETRAWTIRQGATAPEAAGVIHTDFQRGFIAAQVVDYNDLIVAGSESAAKNAGKVRTEGKDYVMQPNDVVEFRFNT